jgi:hypothetical protein
LAFFDLDLVFAAAFRAIEPLLSNESVYAMRPQDDVTTARGLTR